MIWRLVSNVNIAFLYAFFLVRIAIVRSKYRIILMIVCLLYS